MIIDCVADLHGHYPKLNGGDLLIVAGDLTKGDTQEEIDTFDDWLYSQKYKKKIFIAGNHDNSLTNEQSRIYLVNIPGFKTEKFEYLCDSGTEFNGLKIWGSPWTMKFPGMNPHCKAFTVDTEDEMMDKFDKIPCDVDILITHSPAYQILDRTIDDINAGSMALHGWFTYVGRPKLHVFGHIHEAYGKQETFATYDSKRMISVNASHVNEKYQPVNRPVRIETL